MWILREGDDDHEVVPEPDVRIERDGQWVYIGRDGREYSLDERGNRMPPRRSRQVSREGEFREYDCSQGHCNLCGYLGCSGRCMGGG
jgi:hypothetical protein